MITAWPLDNTDYTAEAIGAFCGTRTRGVFSADNNFSIGTLGGRVITISRGIAWLKRSEFWGTAVHSTEPITFEIDVASGTMSRYIAVVIRLDKDANAPEIALRYSAFASSPVPPQPVRDSHADEIFLYMIHQATAAVDITAADISDLRTDEAYCGIMRDGVTGIPTAQLSAQAQELINALKIEIDNIKKDSAVMLKSVYDPENIATQLQNKKDAALQTTAKTITSAINEVCANIRNGSGGGLIDNAEFKVNQRGKALYTNVSQGPPMLTIDRWRLGISVGSDYATLEVVSNGIKFNGHLSQKFERQLTEGTNYTVSYSLENTVYSVTLKPNETVSSDFELKVSLYTHQVVFTRYKPVAELLQWVKVEKGTIATPFVPKSYGEELMECLRYYQELGFAITDSFPFDNTNTYTRSLQTHVPMRIAPSVTRKDGYIYECTIAGTSATVNTAYINIKATLGAWFNCNTTLCLSADL